MLRRVAPLLVLLAACGPGEIEDSVAGDVRGADLVGVAPPVVVGNEPVPEPETETEPGEAPDTEPEAPGDADPQEVRALGEPELAEPEQKASHGFGDEDKPVPAGSQRVTFTFLSDYYYLPSDIREEFDEKELGEAEIEVPERIRKLRGKTVTIEGFMMPTEVDDEQHTKRLVLMRDVPGCCFASVPPINGWIDVVVHADDELDYVPYMIVEATGTFDCGEEIEDGFVLSLYRMTDARVKESTD